LLVIVDSLVLRLKDLRVYLTLKKRELNKVLNLLKTKESTLL
jgi:hypothetical protein